MQVKCESTYTVTLDTAEMGKLARALGRAMEALPHLPSAEYSRLVSLGTVDQLLALRTALYNASPEGRGGDR